MTRAVRRLFAGACLLVAVLACGVPAAFAQGGVTSSLSGTVADATGAVIPGANVVVKNMGTAATSEAVTNAEGQFTVPALNAGKYSVSVTLSGFKTVTINDVVINAGVPAGVKVTMEVGGVEEQVVVTGGSEVVATQSSTVSTTITSKQIQSLPLTSRNGLDFVVNLPGVNTPGTARNSTVNGLPQGSINVTLDGISIQDNYLKTSDGFFARVQPRLDAIEEVTVTSAANGADSGGQGAVNIRFVTKSGTNQFKGNAFFTLRHDALNANTFFNNRVPRVVRFHSLEPRLHIADFDRSVAFYRDVLGFEVLTTFPDDVPSFAILARDGVALQIGGIDTTKTAASPATVTLYFDVGDALDLHASIKDRVKIAWGPEVYFYHRREFAFHDPDGHLIIISEETDDPVTCKEE